MTNQSFICGVRPVVLDTTGIRYYGKNHKAAIHSIPMDKLLDVTVGDAGHAFEKEDGTIIGREEAARFTGLPTHLQQGRLHSEDLTWNGAQGCQNLSIPFTPAIHNGERGFDTSDGTFVSAADVAKEEMVRSHLI